MQIYKKITELRAFRVKSINFEVLKQNSDMISKNRIKYIRSLQMKKNRKADGVFVAEGHKLVGDLLGRFECVYIAAVEEWIEQNREAMAAVRDVDAVTDDELSRISFVETPQQVFAIFRQPVYDVSLADVAPCELCLALDDVQNPGNLGTIVRLADWFGIKHVFCSQGCADIFNPKTVQATMGALARVQVHYISLDSQLAQLPSSTPVYGTFLDGENLYHDDTLSQHGVIVMGNEGKGVSPAVASLVTHRLFIPNYPAGQETSESLNVAVATAVICAEFRRRAL